MLIGVFMGTKPHRNEMLGIMLALIGCIFMIADPKAARIGSIAPSVFPAIMDAASAFFGALYFLMSARNIKHIPICMLILLMSTHTFFINSFVAKI